MKWIFRRRWLMVVAIFVLMAVIYSTTYRTLTVRFVGFRDVNGERRAIFAFENRSGLAVRYATDPAGDPLISYRLRRGEGWGTIRERHSGWSLLGRGGKIEFTAATKTSRGDLIEPPFQAGIRTVQPPHSEKLPRFIPLHWLPDTWNIPHLPTIWSDTVVP